MEKMTLEGFREYVKENDRNIVTGNGIAEFFTDTEGFMVSCKKCGSLRIEICGELGSMGSEYTGWMPGTTVVKCLDCGNAKSIDT